MVFEVLQGYFATEGCLVPERQDYFGTRERRQVGKKNMLFYVVSFLKVKKTHFRTRFATRPTPP